MAAGTDCVWSRHGEGGLGGFEARNGCSVEGRRRFVLCVFIRRRVLARRFQAWDEGVKNELEDGLQLRVINNNRVIRRVRTFGACRPIT